MVFVNMEAEKMLRGEISAAFGTAVCVNLGVMDFEIFKGGKGEGVLVRWE